MARILIVTYGSLGDLHPMVALGLGLKARGHEVSVASNEAYRTKVLELGLGFHAVRPNLSLTDEALVRRIMDGADGSKDLMRKLVFPCVREMHADIAPLAAKNDLLVTTELVCAAPIIGEQTGQPWVYCALSPISFFPLHDPSVLPGPPDMQPFQSMGATVNRFVLRIARMVSHSWWRPVREFRRELGLPMGRSPLFEGKYSPHLNLALFSAALQPAQRDWPANTRQTGFLFHDEADEPTGLPAEVERFLTAGEPPIIFTLGSAAVFLAGNFYHESVQAAAQLGRRALLLMGNNPPPPDLPPSVLAYDYLPYAQIFPRAAAIVHQGGVGTTAQALRAGRPMVVVPFAHDQFDNAARVCRLGVARTLSRRKYQAENVARELARLLGDRDAPKKAAVINSAISSENAVERACLELERVLA